MPNYNFKEDLILGHKGEDVVIQDLLILGATIFGKNDDNAYDILAEFKGKKVSYECKTDVFEDTGNMFIETSSRNKPSGIRVTQADYFVTFFSKLNEIWYIKTSDLLEIINSEEHATSKNCGDKNSYTEGILLNKYKFKYKFIVRNAKTHKTIRYKWEK